jgi:membrane-associated phospholipid phosphatase
VDVSGRPHETDGEQNCGPLPASAQVMLLPRSEWISIVAFAGLVLLAWPRNLGRIRQAKIATIGAAAMAIVVFVSLILPRLVSSRAASDVRNWIPCLLLLLFYSQAGQFVTRFDVETETRLERLDERWIRPCLKWCSERRPGIWLLTCLEAAYFTYYMAVPLAVGALYWLGKQQELDHFWTVVLLAAYGSCGMLLFVQTRPPRMIGEKWSACLPCGKLRALNLWILRHGSIQVNTLPSAHVAITAACALVLLQVGAGWVALAFLGIAIGIAFGAVAGRYHYGVDAILGFLLGAVAFLAGHVQF